MLVEYWVSYNEYTIIGNEEHHFDRRHICKTEEEIKKFIKTLKPKDEVKRITKRTYERLDINKYIK